MRQCTAAPQGRTPGLLASWAAFRMLCPPWLRPGPCVSAVGSGSPWSCRCTARWKAPRFTGCCTCSRAPTPAAAPAVRAAGRCSAPSACRCQRERLKTLRNDANSAKDIDWTARLQDLHLQDAVLGAAPPAPPGMPPFLPYYICVADEDDYRDFVNLDHAHSLLRDYQQREGIAMDQLLSQSLSNDGDEKYEKTIIKSGDQTFYKFMKRIAACQEQILRYSWSGEPLFLTCPASEVTELPACSQCGGQRIFEFQLMPALVSMLKSANLGLSVEFGTILVYTCEKSCWPQNHQTPIEEFCIIQEDPDELLFK
nr:programmed cell death protein 2-like isoform X2 [Saimiri boliviensis boliviensis]